MSFRSSLATLFLLLDLGAQSVLAQGISPDLAVCKDAWKFDFVTGHIKNKAFVPYNTPATKKINETMADAARFFSGLGLKSPNIQCTQQGKGPYALIIDPNAAPWAHYDRPIAGGAPDRVAIRLSEDVLCDFNKLLGKSDSNLTCDSDPVEQAALYTGPHELMHAIEYNYRWFIAIRPAPWVDEGLAEALSLEWYRDYRKSPRSGARSLFPKLNASKLSVHWLNTPLHDALGPTSKPDEEPRVEGGYGTAPFWSFLMREVLVSEMEGEGQPVQPPSISTPEKILAQALVEKAAPGEPDMAIIGRFMDANEDQAYDISFFENENRRTHELHYLDLVIAWVMNDPTQKWAPEKFVPLSGGIYVNYPKFIARRAYIFESRSNTAALFNRHFKGGCKAVNPGDSPTVTIAPVAAACFKVNLGGSKKKTLHVRVKSAIKTELEQLHLGWAVSDSPPVKFTGGRKTWTIMPSSSATTVYVVVTNVGPVARDTTAVTQKFLFELL